MPLEKLRLGGPQFCGCWLFPRIPASPEIFSLFAKFGRHWSNENRLKLYESVVQKRLVKECRQLPFAVHPNELVVSRKSSRLGLSVRVL